MSKNKFEVGMTIEYTSWFTGGTSVRKIIFINGNKLRTIGSNWELDGHHGSADEYEIEVDEEGNERICISSYEEYKGYVYARDCMCSERKDG